MTSKDIESITGLPESLANELIGLYPATVLHTVAEKALDKEVGSLKEVLVELPGVGKIEVTRDGGFLRYFFVPYPEFAEGLDKAMQLGKSPLPKLLEARIVAKIDKAYRDLG